MMHKGLGPLLAGAAQRFRAELDEPGQVQADVLRTILQQQQHSEFGQRHAFAAITDGVQFAAAVPVADYAALAEPIARMAGGAANVLCAAHVLAYEETGGSGEGRKLVPYTGAGLAAFQSGLLPWLDDLCAHFPGLGEGPFYWAISPACRQPGSTAGGAPIGLSDAAYLGPEVGMAVAQLLAVPAEVGAIADVAQWRTATLQHLLACEAMSMISVWSPSFLTELLRHAVEGREALAARLAPRRASLVREELARQRPNYQRLWPRLQVISCWDQASAAAGAAALRAQFPHVLVQGKGLLATEGLVTIPLIGAAWPVLALRAGYFEFVDAVGKACGAEGVIEGQEYQLLMTTHSGLYRYALGDQLVVRGFVGRTPMLEFVGRSNSASDLCGEKLCDAFVAVRVAALGQAFAMLAPDSAAQGQPARYALLLDAAAIGPAQADEAAAALDHALFDNPQYAYARRIGQLAPVLPVLCRNPLQGWLDERSARGQRLGDIKLPSLIGNSGWRAWARPLDGSA